jgi:acetyltransferase-like isoleucine patch superfamily enzyme
MSNNIKIWHPANVYKSAILGNNVSIGMFSEIGNNVVIGEDTRVGGHVFIPEGVTIGKNCFIGPHVVFTNDKYPPGAKADWKKTIVEDNVAIGANATILPGIILKKGSKVGAGAVVTKSVEENRIVIGNPARPKI